MLADYSSPGVQPFLNPEHVGAHIDRAAVASAGRADAENRSEVGVQVAEMDASDAAFRAEEVA